MRTAVLRDALVGEEIQFEALAQRGLVDLADPALPGGARRSTRRCRRRRTRSTTVSKAARTDGASVTSQATRERARRSPWLRLGRAAASTSSSATSAPAAANALAVAAPIAPPAPVTTRDLARERLLGRLAELGLLERPVFACRTSRLSVIDSKRPIASASVMVVDRGLRDVGGDRARPCRCARGRTGRAPAPGSRAAADRARLDAADAGVVAGEIGVVVGDESLDGLGRGALEFVEPAGLGRRHDQRPVLGADRVVGRDDAGAGSSAPARRR